MVNYELIYDGSKSSLDPIYGGPATYQQPLSGLSSAVDARTANQIKEVSEHLNTGIKNIEIQGTSPEILDSIPKQHFKEINRIAKLTGAELSMHAPMIDPTGITQRGWDKMNQDAAARQLWNAIERSHELNPKGNIPVTMHATSAPLPPAVFKIKEKDEEGNIREITKSVLLVDPNGNLAQVKEEDRFFPTKPGEVGKKIKFEPEEEIKRENKELWLKQLDNLNFYAHRGEEVLREIEGFEKLAFEKEQEKDNKAVEDFQNRIKRSVSHGSIYLRDAYMQLKKNFDLVYKKADQEDKKKLDEYAKKVSQNINVFENIEKNPTELAKFSKMIEDGVNTLGQINQPRILTPLRDFAIDKSSETVANLAVKSYKKFGDTSPIISLENHPAGQSILTRAEDIKDVIEKARERFVEKAKGEGFSESNARDAAKKIIGATWDVGHINMLRRYGYTKEDIIKETEKIAPYVKHVHLSDNFGYEHTELPMGMGNVPIKEILKKLGEEGFEGKKVIEAASWWQHFSQGGKQNPPLIPTLQAMGSPIYPMQMAPSWNQVYGTTGGYFAGYGTINPEIHHSLYGAGFSTLPTELGGQIAGKDNRLTGTPMS